MKIKKLGLLFGLFLFLTCGMLGCQSSESGNEAVNSISTPTAVPTSEPTAEPTVEPTAAPTEASEVVHRSTAEDIVADIVLGWNLGNSLDANSGIVGGLSSETVWNNPVVTKELIDAIKAAGFNAVRVPVTWYNHMNVSTYEIHEGWMDRVEEVVNYVLDNEMYCILNVHHDTGVDGWLKASSKNIDMKKARFQSIWEQVSERFGDYGDKLLFEGFNEILDDNDEWVYPGKEALEITNELNQIFVDTVRASGKNNGTRCLIVNTYCAGGNKDVTKGFVLPTDTISNKLIVEAHIYQPYYFTTENSPETTDWAPGKATLESYIKNMYTTFVEKGVPVIIGEFGAVDKDNTKERQSWLRFYIDTCTNYGIKCFWWDNGGLYKIINRHTYEITEPELIEIMLTEARGGTYEFPSFIYGDADGNNTVNEADLALLKQYLDGQLEKVDNCDMNKDGVTDAADAALLEAMLIERVNLCAKEENWGNWIDTANGAAAKVSHVEDGIQIAVESPGKNTWDAQISYNKLSLEQGATYKLSFDYTGSPAQTMSCHVMQDYGAYQPYFSYELEYKEETQHYEVVFQMTEATDNNVKFAFDCGASELGVPYTITIKNLVLIKLLEGENVSQENLQ